MSEEQRATITDLASAAHDARERFGTLAMMNRSPEPEARKQQAIAYANARAAIFNADRLLIAEMEG